MKSNECIGPHPVPKVEMGFPYDNPDVAIGFSHLLLPENNDCRIVVFSLHTGFQTYNGSYEPETTSTDDAFRLIHESERYFAETRAFASVPRLEHVVRTARVQLANKLAQGEWH